MATYRSVKTDILTLSETNQRSLFNFLSEVLSASPLSISESHFAKEVVCPHCEETNIIKHGKVNDTQRYKCKSCDKTFTDFTKSALAHTHRPLHNWLEYAKCMILGFSLRRSTSVIKVSLCTSFYMRHRILYAVRLYFRNWKFRRGYRNG